MASPQWEEGYTKIANEIIEALWKINLSPYESRVLWYLFRKTYGFQKKTDWITLSQFSLEIGIDRRLIHRTLKKLSSKQMTVIQTDDNNRIRYGFQKNYDKWELSSKQMTVIQTDDGVSSKQMTRVSSKQIPTINTLTKETSTKDKIYIVCSEIFEFWNSLKIVVHREIKKYIPHISARLKKYTCPEIKEAIWNYAVILKHEDFFWTYKWGLDEFLSRKGGLDKFHSANDPFHNFLIKKEDQEEKEFIERLRKEKKNGI